MSNKTKEAQNDEKEKHSRKKILTFTEHEYLSFIATYSLVIHLANSKITHSDSKKFFINF